MVNHVDLLPASTKIISTDIEQICNPQKFRPTKIYLHTLYNYICTYIKMHDMFNGSTSDVSLAAQLTIRYKLLEWDIPTMLACQSLCEGSVTTTLNCVHYCLPSAGEVSRSCLVGGPLAQQVQHTVSWFALFSCFNGLQDLVFHSQECAKVPPFCIQFVF